MRIKTINFILICLLFIAVANKVTAQTVGLLNHKAGAELGYSMISRNGTAYLLDTAGQVLHTWEHGTNSKHPGYLQDNGDWIAVSKGIKRYNWSGELIWEYSNTEAHHDIAVKPNGNILLLVWGSKTNAEAIAAGRDPNLLINGLKPMMIYEINPLGQLVWEWHVWDHLIQDFDQTKDNFGVVSDHPELMDINYIRNTGDDWLHGNAIDYNPELEQILVSPRFVNELWIIDQSTTTMEAASHSGGNAGKGGDLLYRWGNPDAYGAVGVQLNFGGHDAQWIKPGLPGEGNIIFFNNGGNDYGRDGNYSSIDEFTPPLNGYNYDRLVQGIYGPLSLVWTYQEVPQEDFFSSFISGTQRLSNGNTLIDEGDKGLVFEVSSEHEIVSTYQNPIANSGILYQGDQVPEAPATSLFRVSRYPKNHPAFSGRNLEPIASSVEQYFNIAMLTIHSPQPDLLIYPTVEESELGVGQKIPLIFKRGGQYIFSHWVITSGDAIVADQFSEHTTLIMGVSDTTVQPNYQINPDWIFGHGFE